jgi:hypothetical protein
MVRKQIATAREIEARRTGSYRATLEELQAIDDADRSGMAADEEVEAAFRTFRRTRNPNCDRP